MRYKERYLVPQIDKDLRKKMVFIGGPRQVGKTTMAKHILGKQQKGYLNWDHAEHRELTFMGQLNYVDLVSLERVDDVGKLEMLMLRLPALVGSPLSINALGEDLQVSHRALSNWLNIFERLYAIFRIPPFGSPLIRAVKKEQKH